MHVLSTQYSHGRYAFRPNKPHHLDMHCNTTIHPRCLPSIPCRVRRVSPLLQPNPRKIHLHGQHPRGRSLALEQPSRSSLFPPVHLQQIPLPPLDSVLKLHQLLLDTLLQSLRSVSTLHLVSAGWSSLIPSQLPLWVVTYWKEAYELRTMRQDWDAACIWVERRSRGSTAGRRAQVEITATFSSLQ